MALFFALQYSSADFNGCKFWQLHCKPTAIVNEKNQCH